MAEIARPTGGPSLNTLNLSHAFRQGGLNVGENTGIFAACYVKASDGKVYNAIGTAANAAARVRGFADTNTNAAQSQPVTLLHGCEAAWATGLNPGSDLYLSATVPGGLTDTPTTGGVNPVGYVMDAARIYLYPIR